MKRSLAKIKAKNAVGRILAHDITRKLPGKFKTENRHEFYPKSCL
jgi:hypothetical protein